MLGQRPEYLCGVDGLLQDNLVWVQIDTSRIGSAQQDDRQGTIRLVQRSHRGAVIQVVIHYYQIGVLPIR